MRGLRTAAAIAIACALGGCQAGIFREWSMDGGSSLSLDASQRLVFVTERGGRGRDQRIVCAEPSPDSITSMSATLAASAGQSNTVTRQVVDAEGKPAFDAAGKPIMETRSNDAQAALAAGFAQNAAFIGMRTQTIQLLRDGLFRACEAYMNGAIDEVQYSMLLVNMPRIMAALVATDGLTGRPAAPPVILAAPSVKTSVTPGANGPGGSADVAPSTVTQVTSEVLKLPAPDNQAAVADAVRDITLSITRQPTMHGLCVSLMAAAPDPKAAYDYRQYDANFREVVQMCRQIFKGLPQLYAKGETPVGGSKGPDARPAAMSIMPQ
ncbi:hypothetical protein ABB55_05180 [Prosthecomicrobium hirschii]|uniref:Lipoprotein n=1 Tax=Prosthecodimorpha hirschii TaxID=665126 RepID=A0A0P6VKN1_9HYPH|nr:hypothetical protein [Prosthecomicrobium hirschii]KPL51695.1 hypothetical protein ABB55_05180 [Prosthecomicrobium hirschii]